MARYFAVLLATSGLVSAIVHPLPNLTDMSVDQRAAITTTCVLAGTIIWWLPWDRWPRSALLVIPPIGLGVKMWANLMGGLGPYSYSIHFVLIYVWMGVALPRWTPLWFSPLLAIAYGVPLLLRGDPRQTASLAMVLPICVVIGESVAWISNRLREVEQVDGQRMQWMDWLVEASVGLAHEDEMDGLTARIAGLANDLPGATGAAVLLLATGRTLRLEASQGFPRSLPGKFVVSETPALLETIRSGEPLRWEHPDCRALAEQLGVARLAVAPLVGSSRCVGVLLLSRSEAASRFDPFTRDVVDTLRVQSGLAIERIRDREAFRDASQHDELTGLGNRRKASLRFESLEEGDALVMVDLDLFKRVNDELGHARGDDALRELAAYLTTVLRAGDEAFRLGGEEFLVVLTGAREDAGTAAERIRAGWELLAPITTFSAGVALHRDGQSAEETLENADRALYAAKEAGRDRVVVSD